MSFNRYTKTFIFVVRMKSSSKEFLKTKVSHPLTKKYSHIIYTTESTIPGSLS